MSTNLYWDIVKPRRNKSLDNQLKYILAPVYWNHDGSLMGEEIIITTDQLSYLCGIRDGSRDREVKQDCDVLIDALQKHGSIKVWIE